MTGARALTDDLLKRLERHYIKPGEAYPGGTFLPEVTYGGAGGSRADALYVGFTASSGRILVGHELKVSRADWRRELDHPGKADAWADECHAWYVVAPSDQVVKPEELPPGWGLMLINPRTTTRLDIAVRAEIHADRQPTWTAVRSILSRADTLRGQSILDAREKARAAMFSEVDQRVQARLEQQRATQPEKRLQDLGDRLAAIQAALGLDIDVRDDTVWPLAGTATLAELRAAAVFLRAHVTTQRAARDLAGRYADPLNEARGRFAALADSIDQLTRIAQTTAEEASA